MESKAALRAQLRAARRAYVQSLPDSVRGLLFHRPPRALVEMIPADATIGAYVEAPDEEAPATGYARWFFEAGHSVALPWFGGRDHKMEFQRWLNPLDDSALVRGPWGVRQFTTAGEAVVPDVLFVPLVAFTGSGDRLGMGAGHFDRWLGLHPDALAIGLAWDCQEVATLPIEPHDRPLDAIVTQTRLLGRFDR